MKAKYLAVWKLHGANTLATTTNNFELARLSNPTLIAVVTDNPEPYFLHIDQSAAIANQLIRGIAGIGGSDQHGTYDEQIAAEVETAKANRAKETSKGVFLVISGDKDVANPNFKLRRDTERFAVCFDAIDKPDVKEVFRPSLQAVLTAVDLSQATKVDHLIEKVGEVIYLVEPETDKPIYTFTAQMSAARLSVASPFTDAVAANAVKRIPKLVSDKVLARPASLLITSLDRGTDALQAFIAAWSALEIFVNATFKATYELEWFSIMERGAPSAAKPIFERLKDVMSDKYRLVGKFLIIASGSPRHNPNSLSIVQVGGKKRRSDSIVDKSVLALPSQRRIRDRDHVKSVAKQPCLVCGRRPADAHHLRFAQSPALGRKVSDEFTVPLCRGHHREVHRCGDEAAWWKRTGIDPSAAARVLWLKTHPLPSAIGQVGSKLRNMR
jgi:hypothetical protein